MPWVAALPNHWKVERAKGRFQKLNRPIRPEDETVTCFRDGTVTLRKNRRLRGFTEAIYELGYQGIRKGDLVIHAMDAFAGAVGVSDSDGKGSPIYGVCRPKFDDSPHYFAHVVREMSRTQWILALSRGIRERSTDFRFESFARQFVPLPPPDEQAAIVRFLDHANGKIERAIRAKRKLIGLLNEQKQAIIHRAVTRGLDPNVKLKPSGIPWLGDVPEHWEVRRLRHLINGKLSYGANAAAEFTNQDWPRYIRITDFRTDGSLKPDTFRSLPPTIASDYMVVPGDILFARSGATVGKAFLVLPLTGAACHAGYLIRARPDLAIVYPEYLFAFTQSKSFFSWKDSTFNTATIQNIGADKYANLTVPLPDLHEQLAILEFLSLEQGPLLAMIARLEREIELLREYRTTLTAEVVTGKLDVREAAKRLPDEAVETLPPDDSMDELIEDEIDQEDEA